MEALEPWNQCRCECVYCGTNMVESRGLTYFLSATKEHLLPKSKYPHLENDPSDWVLSCRPCNALKVLWDPNTDGGKQIYFDGSLTKEQRQILIQRVKDYLRPLRECLDTRFIVERRLLLEGLQ